MSYTLLDNRDKDLINQDINKVFEQYNIKNKFGSSIVVNDSADFSIMGMKLYGKTTQPTTTGKNLFDIDTVKTNYINPGTGVEEANDSWKNTPSISCKANTTYTFSMKTKEFFQFAVSFYDSNKNFISGDSKSDYNITQYTFTTPSNTSFMRVGYSFKLSSGEVVRDEIMLNEGTEALPWEKFSGGQPSPSPNYPQPLESKGKWGNLLENTATSKTDKGLTYTVNKDKSITIIGTPTGSSNISIGRFDKKGEFILTLGTNIKNMVYEVNVYNSKEEVVANFTTIGRTFNTNDYNDYSYMFIVLKRNENVYTNETAYPMIVEADSGITEYRPYSGQKEVQSGVYGNNLFDVNEVVTWKSYGSTNINYKTKTYKLKPNTEYVCATNVPEYSIIYFGDGTSFIGNKTYTTNSEGTIEVIVDADKIVNYEVMICEKTLYANIYEPYTKQSHISLVGDGLKGFELGATIPNYIASNPLIMEGVYWDGKQYVVADTVDCERGVLVQRIGRVVLDGVSDYGSFSHFDSTFPSCNGALLKEAISETMMLQCSHFAYNENYMDDTFAYITAYGSRYVMAKTPDFTSVEDGNNWLAEQYAKGTPVTIQYILKEPIITPLSASELASYKALKSNYKVTSVMNDCDAEMEIKYAGDAYTSGLSDVINKSIDNKVGNIDSKVLVNGAEYGIDRIQIEKTDGQLQLVFRAADGTRKGAINFDLAETTTE